MKHIPMPMSLFVATLVLIACGHADSGSASRYAEVAAEFSEVDFDQSYDLVRISIGSSAVGTLGISRRGDRETLELRLDAPRRYHVRIQFGGADAEEVCVSIASEDRRCRTIPQEIGSNPFARGKPAIVLNSHIREVDASDRPFRDSVCFLIIPNDRTKKAYTWKECYGSASKVLQYTEGIGAARFIGTLSAEFQRAFPETNIRASDLDGLGLLAENQ